MNRSSRWNRFWCPRGDALRLDDGYLTDPEEAATPHLLATEELAPWPCLILLGEPGMGKTTGMGQLKLFESGGQPDGAVYQWHELGKFQTDFFLIQEVFRGADVEGWRAGDSMLHLFLDGLDECRLRIDTASRLLAGEINRLPAGRLKLRISCRTTEWPNALEEALVKHFGQEHVGIFRLAPLRKRDVIEEATAKRIPNAEHFLRDVERHDAVPLASRPITLEFLLNIAEAGKFPATRAQLYREGVLRLCMEPNPSRQTTSLMGVFTAEQRLKAVIDIAGLMVLANRTAINTAPDFGGLPESDLTLSDLAQVGPCGSFGIAITPDYLREVLDTNVFTTAEGHSRYRFSHHTYAEFLAAELLIKHRVPLAQLRDLLAHPLDSGGRIIPQLAETAAWIAEMNEEFFRYVLERDPEVLLRSDVATADQASKRALVSRLLEEFDRNDLFDQQGRLNERYSRLDYPGIAEQLKPYVEDRSKGDLVRRTAIQIAGQCSNAAHLMCQLAEIALDLNDSMVVREQAALAVRESGDDESRLKLKTLAQGVPDDDPEDELKGIALGGLWPRLIAAEELFSYLAPPKRKHFLGAYEWFLRKRLLDSLPSSDLPIALRWVSNQPARRELGLGLRGVIDRIFAKAWDAFDVTGVRTAFAGALASRIRLNDPLFDQIGMADVPAWEMADPLRRRAVAAEVLAELPDDNISLFSLTFDAPRLVRPEDSGWIVEQIRAGQRHGDAPKWIRLARILVERTHLSPSELDIILNAAQEMSPLAAALAEVTSPIEIDSPLADRLRAAYHNHDGAAEREPNPAVTPPPQERVRRLIELIDKGDTSQWVTLNMELTLDIDSTHYEHAFYTHITETPGWRESDAATRGRILLAGERYLEQFEPQTCRTVDENVLTADGAAGFRALVLLSNERPGIIQTLNDGTWKKWAAITLAFPTGSGFANDEFYAGIVAVAYRKAPDEIIGALLRLIDKENREMGRLFILHKMSGCWDERLGAALAKKAMDPSLQAASFGDLIRELLSHHVFDISEYAASLAGEMLPVDGSGSSKSREAAVALLEANHEIGWPLFWRAAKKNPPFAKQVLLDFVHRPIRHPRNSPTDHLSDDDTANLFIWIMRQFPPGEDPEHRRDAVYTVTARHEIVDLRNRLLGNLEGRGTVESLSAINRIVEEFPQIPWLKWARAEARRRMLEHNWTPPSPLEIAQVVGRPSARFVESGEQLLEVLQESIDRLNERLQGATSAAEDLWNNERRQRWWPKDEESLSDYLMRFWGDDLRDRNIVVNREVQIRRGNGAASGDVPDFIVDAFLPGSNGSNSDVISVVVEVKCEWHRDVKRAMRDTLRHRYLNESGYRYGLYVVGWFDGPAWNRDTKKYRRPLGWRTLTDAKRFLDRDALELSHDGVFIKAAVVNASLRAPQTEKKAV